MRSTANVRSAFEHRLHELTRDKDKDDEYLAQRTAGDPLTLYSRSDLPKASNTSAQMTESEAKRDLQLATESLKTEFSTKFGIAFGERLFAKTVSLAGAQLDGGALTVGDAKNMFLAAETVAQMETEARARKAELTQQAKQNSSTASTAAKPEAATTTATTTNSSTTPVTSTAVASQAPMVLVAPDADLFDIVVNCKFVLPLARENHVHVYGLMSTARSKLSTQASCPAEGTAARTIALRRAAEGELIKFDIQSRRGLAEKDVVFLKFLIDKAFRQPEHVLLHAVSSQDMHKLLLKGDLEELCNLFNRGRDGPDALAALAQGGEAKAQPFLAFAPKGMKVDYKGHISGEQTIRVVPSEPARRMVGHAGKPIHDVMQFVAKGTLGKLDDVVAEVGASEKVFLPSSARGDFPRFRYKVAKNGDGSDGQWQEWAPGGAAPQVADPYRYVARQLFLFVSKSKDVAPADKVNAVKVLTAAVCQATLHVLQDFLATANGTGVEFLTCDRGLGTVQWTLTKTKEGNYAIDIHLPVNLQVIAPLHPDPAETRKNKLRAEEVQLGLDVLVGKKNASIGATFSLTIIMDAKKAEQGEVQVSIPDGMRVAFHDAI